MTLAEMMNEINALGRNIRAAGEISVEPGQDHSHGGQK